MVKKTLSVIVPVYNVAQYLNRCLDSLLGQTRLPDEIICVDDGSTDESGRILDEYAASHSVIKVVHKPNGGLVSARKAGLRLAQYEYITYVDSDDWIEDDMYIKMMRHIERTGAEVATSGIIHDYGTHAVIENEHSQEGLFVEKKLRWLKNNLVDSTSFFRRNISFGLVNKIVKKELLEAFQEKLSDEVTIGEDVAVSYPYMLSANSIYVTGNSFYHYCHRDNSIMGKLSPDEKGKTLLMLDHLSREYNDSKRILPGIYDQFKRIELYDKLLICPEEVVSYENGYLYPYGPIVHDSKIVIYGAGTFGQHMMGVLRKIGFEIVAWIDKSAKGDDIRRPQDIPALQFDVILITVLLADVVDSIVMDLKKADIEETKIKRVSVTTSE